MLHLLTLWFWYLIAFGAGAAAMWFALPRLVPARTPDEALDLALDRAERAHQAEAADATDEEGTR